MRRPGRVGRFPRRRFRNRGLGLAVGAGFATALLAGCDDQVKYVPWFSAMVQQPAIETFEEAPWPAPEGSVPVDGEPSHGLLEADTALANALRATSENVARGRALFGQFCTPCHGVSGEGDGPVILSDARPRGIPPTPALDLHSDRAQGFSDGYLWGMITNGRGLMPSYRRIPRDERWHIVLYVRHLQQTGGDAVGTAAPSESGAPSPSGSPAAASGGGGSR